MNGLQNNIDNDLKALKDQEYFLEQHLKFNQITLSGLVDIDKTLKLIRVKIGIVNRIMKERRKDDSQLFEMAREKTREALNLFEETACLNISLDQADNITSDKEYNDVKEELKQLILTADKKFFQEKTLTRFNVECAAKIIFNALQNHIIPDDEYQPLFKTELLPRFLRRIVNMYLPVLGKENKQEPPFGIKEGEEVVYTSEKMKMPLSQALFYMEEELLPSLEQKLGETPNDLLLQAKIASTKETIENLKSITISQRAMPVMGEKDFYTTSYTQYTNSGEPLVNIPIPVSFYSGTNISRIQEEIKSEITRKLAGKGISSKLDKEYYELKSLSSGIRGSSRMPGSRINTARWFIVLKKEIPFLNFIDSKPELTALLDMIRRSKKLDAITYIQEKLLDTSDTLLKINAGV